MSNATSGHRPGTRFPWRPLATGPRGGGGQFVAGNPVFVDPNCVCWGSISICQSFILLSRFITYVHPLPPQHPSTPLQPPTSQLPNLPNLPNPPPNPPNLPNNPNPPNPPKPPNHAKAPQQPKSTPSALPPRSQQPSRRSGATWWRTSAAPSPACRSPPATRGRGAAEENSSGGLCWFAGWWGLWGW